MRHINIPIFIPHLGCPNQCVFCNQRNISGVENFCAENVSNIIEQALLTVPDKAEVEIAFFGGSFTGIDRTLMISLLEKAYRYIEDGRVSSIRCSTRPDYIDEEIIRILKQYGVKTVELGIQSSSDEVLKISKRGHNFEAEKKACDLIVKNGIKLIGQMMIGLPGSDPESEMETARFIIENRASGARIYPTVVFHNTELCQMTLEGKYSPLTVEEAIDRSTDVFDLFLENGVEVIRIGLQSNENLSDEKSYLAGPNHPALGELVIGESYYRKICKLLDEAKASDKQNIEVFVSPGCLSKAVGQNKKNKIRLEKKYGKIRFAEDTRLSGFQILVKQNDGE